MKSNKTIETNNSTSSNGATVNTNRLRKNKQLINNDYCSFCDEGGDLLSCDRCPASFHFLCHNPPLNFDQIPKGDFWCNKCKTISNLKEKSPVNELEFQTNQSLNHDTKTIRFELEENEPALESLIRIAKSLNPRQMQLSSDLNVECSFDLPGLNKIKWWTKDGNKIVNVSKHSNSINSNIDNNLTYKNGFDSSKSKIYHLNEENEIIKAVKSNDTANDPSINSTDLCFTCSKTSNDKTNLVKCDFCPLKFHLNCLNQPMCSIPSKDRLWMCPNHLENFLDQNIIKSTRLSERISLWKEYSSANINLESIKVDFINKCTQSNTNEPTMGSNVPRCKIPDSIKNMYCKQDVVYEDPSKLIEVDNSKFENDKERETYLSAVEALTLLSEPEPIRQKVTNSEQFLLNPPPLHNYNFNSIKPRALLLPIQNSLTEAKKIEVINSLLSSEVDNAYLTDFKQPYQMKYRFLTIGSASNMDISLACSCDYISAKHCCIYYDEDSNHYELLNYSEFGTLVDNSKYSYNILNDFNSDSDDSDQKMMSSKSLNSILKNQCDCNKQSQIGAKYWEGPAILNHGSFIVIGCFKFLFIIVDSNYDFASALTFKSDLFFSEQSKSNKLYNIKKNDLNLCSLKLRKRFKPKNFNGLNKNKNFLLKNAEGFIKLINNKRKKLLLN